MTDAMLRTALVVSETPELALGAKVTVLLVVGLAVAWLVRHAAASVRALVLASTFAALALLPLVTWLVPVFTVPVETSGVRASADEAVPLPVSRDSDRGEALDLALASDSTPVRSITTIDAAVVLRGLWMLGALMTLVPLVGTLWRLRTIRLSGVEWPGGERLVRRLAADAGIRRVCAVRRHEAVRVPMTSGLFRPALLLPWDAPAWSDTDLERACVHEIEHVRRADWAVRLLAGLVCAAWWFHPLVWIASRQLHLAAERACDDAVLRREEGPAYAAQLVSLAERLSGREPRPLLAMASRRDLSARIEAILDEAQPRRRAGAPLVAAAACLVVLSVLMVAPLTAGRDAQAAQEQVSSRPAFDVASIRRQDGVQVPSGPPARPPAVTAQFDRLNATAVSLIQFAYGVRATEIVGGPDWARNDRFQISARAATPVGPEQMQLMVQSLLEDRFQLVLRTEPREMRYFELVRARDDRLGPGLERCDDPVAAANAPPGPPVRVPAGGVPWQQRCRPLSAFADSASGLMEAPIVDRTGLDGLWSFLFMFLQPNLPPGPQRDMAAQEGTPSFEGAVREHLGLMFESRRGPVDVLVIDSVEPPSEN